MDRFEQFCQLMSGPAVDLPLDEAAFLMASHARADLDIDHYLARLDDLASGCPAPTPDGVLSHLFHTLGYRGNEADYYDPRNSFLDQVIDSQRGIPITLAVLAIEIGRRVGTRFEGVGMPGHFLLRDCDTTAAKPFADPFDGGRRLDVDECRSVFQQLHGGGVEWHDAYLEPVGRPLILARMLANLQQIYSRQSDVGSLRWVMRLRCALPDATEAHQREFARLMAPSN